MVLYLRSLNQLINNKFKLGFLIGLLFICINIFMTGCASEPSSYYANEGKLDLRQYNASLNGNIKLDGQWELYPDALLEPMDFQKEVIAKDYFTVPGTYKKTDSNQPLAKYGYGTIRLLIDMPPVENKTYGIIIRQALTASKVWVNGIPISASGTVGTSSSDAVNGFERQMFFFTSNVPTAEIIIQMSNYDNITGRVRNIIFGESISIKRTYISGVASDIFIAGALFIMAIYHFALFYKRRRFKAPLYFGFLCIVFALRNVLVGGRLIYEIYPEMPFFLLNKLAYLTVYAGFPFILLFFKSMFPKAFSSLVVKILSGISIIVSLITILLPIHIYSKFLTYYEILLLLTVIYVIIVITIAAIKKVPSTRILLFGILVFLFAAINDMLVQEGLLQTRSLASYGFFVFIFSQSYILAAQFSENYAKIENLLEENKAIYRDVLTGILNRRGFYEQAEMILSSAFQNDSSFIVIYGDLNKFKSINDRFGHKEGDEAIKKSAQLMKDSFDSEDIVARISGDEFLAIKMNHSSKDDAELILQTIKEKFNQYNAHSHKPYKLSIALGYSIYHKKSGISLDELISSADIMLYNDKALHSGKIASRD